MRARTGQSVCGNDHCGQGVSWSWPGVVLGWLLRPGPGLACLAADLRDWHRAAILHGIAQALTEQTGTPWEHSDERRRQESLDQARQALGGEQTQRAHTRGMALSFDQAIDLVLGEVPPAT
jgi:hypothetical protein